MCYLLIKANFFLFLEGVEDTRMILKERYHFNSGPLMQQARNILKQMDGKVMNNEFDIQILDLLASSWPDRSLVEKSWNY
ncbi:glutamine--tRNA ligase-like [Solenopsis invicta]|uniref:glutamine--tRNA ligase-like n=1 Tax=Solenopsis invicta TaxID=13686 RepID=UPI00193E5C2A|nr:glutamine--tRNA ligase-like [Solenopsis invicta]